jgi:hypothetical protein
LENDKLVAKNMLVDVVFRYLTLSSLVAASPSLVVFVIIVAMVDFASPSRASLLLC